MVLFIGRGEQAVHCPCEVLGFIGPPSPPHFRDVATRSDQEAARDTPDMVSRHYPHDGVHKGGVDTGGVHFEPLVGSSTMTVCFSAAGQVDCRCREPQEGFRCGGTDSSKRRVSGYPNARSNRRRRISPRRKPVHLSRRESVDNWSA